MGQTPNPKNIPRIVIAGTILGTVGIVLFISVWLILGSMNVDALPRLVISVCLPPGLLTIGIILYILIKRPFSQL